jgi:hypothetical protein
MSFSVLKMVLYIHHAQRSESTQRITKSLTGFHLRSPT